MNTPRKKANAVLPNGRFVVGIDVGQSRHAAAAFNPTGQLLRQLRSFTNNRSGIDKLQKIVLRPCGTPKNTLIGMEATGPYWMPLYFELKRRGYEPIVLNPIQTGNRSRARIRKTKTDRIDALTIARLINNGEAQAARIPSEPIFELRLLVRHRWRLVDYTSGLKRFIAALTEMLFPEYTHLFDKMLNVSSRALIREIGLAPNVIAASGNEVETLMLKTSRRQISKDKICNLLEQAQTSIGIARAQSVLTEQIRSTIALIETFEKQIILLDQELGVRAQQLNSPLTGLGLNAPLVTTIHAESDPILDFKSTREYVAFTGFDPTTSQSGNSRASQTQISKRGSPYLRQAFYLAAAGLYRNQHSLYHHYKKSRKKGLHHTAALVVVAHKLARITWRLLTENRPFKKRPPKPNYNAK